MQSRTGSVKQRVALIASAGLIMSMAGCRVGPRQAGPVDRELAQQSLVAVLDSWKNGGNPNDLKSHSPAIIVQDFDWMTGYRLVDYRLLDKVFDDGPNLRCPVKLQMMNPQGRKVEKQVRYMVGTDPAITVFRELPM